MKTRPWAAAATAIIAAAAIGGAASAASPKPQHASSSGVAVSRADFDRLEGQVQDLERRVAALEKGHGGGHSSQGGKPPAGDAWSGH